MRVCPEPAVLARTELPPVRHLVAATVGDDPASMKSTGNALPIRTSIGGDVTDAREAYTISF